jgi:hypothetical protein
LSRHPNVVRLYGYCLEPPTVCLILELLPLSLKELLYGAPSGTSEHRQGSARVSPGGTAFSAVPVTGNRIGEPLEYHHANTQVSKPFDTMLEPGGTRSAGAVDSALGSSTAPMSRMASASWHSQYQLLPIRHAHQLTVQKALKVSDGAA